MMKEIGGCDSDGMGGPSSEIGMLGGSLWAFCVVRRRKAAVSAAVMYWNLFPGVFCKAWAWQKMCMAAATGHRSGFVVSKRMEFAHRFVCSFVSAS